MEKIKLMAIDFGEKVIGLAIFDQNNDPYPTPFDRIVVKNFKQTVAKLKDIIDNECVNALILGVPKLLDGKETKMTAKVQHFGEKLKSELSLPIHYQDETLSTYEAKERMKSSPKYNFKVDLTKIDQEAACVILEDYLSSNK